MTDDERDTARRAVLENMQAIERAILYHDKWTNAVVLLTDALEIAKAVVDAGGSHD